MLPVIKLHIITTRKSIFCLFLTLANKRHKPTKHSRAQSVQENSSSTAVAVPLLPQEKAYKIGFVILQEKADLLRTIKGKTLR